MKQKTVQRIVWAASIIGLAVDVVALVIVVSAWSGLSVSGPFVTATATAAMIATLALQATFVIMQLFPNGRATVPVGMFGPDGWSYVIISTAIPGALWHELAALAFPYMRLIMPGFITPLFISVLLLVGRVMHQRRIAAIRE
jgi:hypothetical protein